MGLFTREYTGPPAWLLPPDDSSTANARAARRTIRFFAVAVFVLVVGGVFAYTVNRERQHSESRPTTTRGASTSVVTVVDSAVGAPAGADVGEYLDVRRDALAAATGDRVAVVSLDDYLSEPDARAAVGSLLVDGLLVAAPGAHPSVVTNGLDAWAKSQQQADQLERDEIRRLLPTVDDQAFKRFYESEVVRLNAAIASVSPTSPVVFGLVVRGPADTLKALAAKAGIRLVDVGKGPVAAPGVVYTGLRPEETTKTGEPGTRPV